MAYSPRWEHFRTTVQSKAAKVQTEHPSAWEKCKHPHDDGEFIRFLAVECHAVEIRCGLNGKRGNVNDLSKDILAFPNETGCRDTTGTYPGLELADVIPGHEGPNASIGWTDVTQATIDGGAAGAWVKPATIAPPQPGTALGISFFGAVGLYLHDQTRYNEFRAFHRAAGVAYARIFYYLADGPWGLVGTGHRADSERSQVFRTVCRHLIEDGIQIDCCVFGVWVEDNTRRRLIVELAKADIRAIGTQHFFHVCCYNEPGAIHVPEYGYVREAGRQLADLGLARLSLASPNTLHIGVDGRRATDAEVAADTSKLYDAMPAGINAIGPHWGRDPWEPNRPLGPSAAGKAIINDEPRGIQSSVSWISAPADFAADVQRDVAAGVAGYTLHGEPGIWHGYCDTRGHPDWEHNNSLKTWQAVPQITEIVSAIHSVLGGTAPGPIPQPPGEIVRAYPQESELHSHGKAVHAAYAAVGRVPDPEAIVWETRPLDDYYRGTEPFPHYSALRILELRTALGAPPL